MPLPSELKVSYCTTCKGRLSALMQTLPKNLEAEKNKPNAEFVVLDYDSRDGLADWIKGNFQKEMENGRLRYIRFEPAQYFEFAHAKNMAHCAATGDILCNVDADNFVAPGTTKYLQDHFARNPNILVSPTIHTLRAEALKRGLRLRGLGGRIALTRDNFERLNGYNEAFAGWGDEDRDLLQRARHIGLKRVDMPPALIIPAIDHGNDERVKNVAPALQAESLKRASRTQFGKVYSVAMGYLHTPAESTARNEFIGSGTVYINFSEIGSDIPPLDQRARLAAGRKHLQEESAGASPHEHCVDKLSGLIHSKHNANTR